MKTDKAQDMDRITTELPRGGRETAVKGIRDLVTNLQQEETIPEDCHKWRTHVHMALPHKTDSIL